MLGTKCLCPPNSYVEALTPVRLFEDTASKAVTKVKSGHEGGALIDQGCNVKAEAIKRPEEKLGEYLHTLGAGKDFFHGTLKALTLKKKLIHWTYQFIVLIKRQLRNDKASHRLGGNIPSTRI